MEMGTGTGSFSPRALIAFSSLSAGSCQTYRAQKIPQLLSSARVAGSTASSWWTRKGTLSKIGRDGIISFKQPHSVFINPYDPEKHVWVVDNMRHAIFEFTNDGKELVRTFGTPNEPGADDKHFAQPTSVAWLPDGTMFVSDGYDNTRVVKFDKDGKYLMAWGEKGNPPQDTRPGYLNSVHNVLVDPTTRLIYVNDRGNRRIQVFDENGKFKDQWSIGSPPQAEVQAAYLSADRRLWVGDRGTSKIIGYDLEGHLLYAWGSKGDLPGELWGVHGISVDQEGNLYLAEVSNGRVEKFKPRNGANPLFLVGTPVRPVWH